jgi:hypothetical protein
LARRVEVVGRAAVVVEVEAVVVAWVVEGAMARGDVDEGEAP